MHEISDEQRDATLANLRAMNAALEAEAQMRRDAAAAQLLLESLEQIAKLYEDNIGMPLSDQALLLFEARGIARYAIDRAKQ